MAAVVEISPGEPVPAHYPGPAVGYIIEGMLNMFRSMVYMLNWPDCIGEVHLKDDSKPDEVIKLVAGDVLHIENGTHNTFTTPNKAKGRYKIIYKLPNWFDTFSSIWCLLQCIAPPPRGPH